MPIKAKALTDKERFIISRAARFGVTPGGVDATERQAYKLIDQELLAYVGRVYRPTEKGMKALASGYYEVVSKAEIEAKLQALLARSRES